jgi:hypothetical protein
MFSRADVPGGLNVLTPFLRSLQKNFPDSWVLNSLHGRSDWLRLLCVNAADADRVATAVVARMNIRMIDLSFKDRGRTMDVRELRGRK